MSNKRDYKKSEESEIRFENDGERIHYLQAKKRVNQLRGFYGNFAAYCFGMPFLVFINLSTSPNYHWFWWPVLGGGISLLVHALLVFGIGKDWENRKIRELMEREKHNF